jgi:hypothetical protein
MAKRPVFIPLYQAEHLVDEVQVEFEWQPGFAPSQKKKNVSALHAAAAARQLSPLLEVSTKSEEELGRRLSAFSLKVRTCIGPISIESAYQGSKVFEHGGPYRDIYRKESREAKTDFRIRGSGRLIRFDYFGEEWPLVPKTAFYDWLYLQALSPYQKFLERLFIYKGFTDIEFNPEKSINCQARTCALLLSLLRLGVLDYSLKTQANFIETTASDSFKKEHSVDLRQRELL